MSPLWVGPMLVVRSNNVPKRKKDHVLIISKKPEANVEQSVRELIVKNVTSSDLGVGISRTKVTKNGDFLIQVENEKDLLTVEEKLASIEDTKDLLSCRRPRLLQPLLLDFDVSDNLPEEFILEAVCGVVGEGDVPKFELSACIKIQR